MVKRKEVKIDEEQIRRMMTGDIPAVFVEKNYGDNAAGFKREGDEGLDTDCLLYTSCKKWLLYRKRSLFDIQSQRTLWRQIFP